MKDMGEKDIDMGMMDTGGGTSSMGGEKRDIERGNVLAGERRWTPHSSFWGVFMDTR
jgi:translation elongation factor EF-Tu-like GTPase